MYNHTVVDFRLDAHIRGDLILLSLVSLCRFLLMLGCVHVLIFVDLMTCTLLATLQMQSLWCAQPCSVAATCYFKSANSLAGNWGLSIVRLNLCVALLAGIHASRLVSSLYNL